MSQKHSAARSFNPHEIRNQTIITAIGVGFISWICVVVTFLGGLGFFSFTLLFPEQFEFGDHIRNVDWGRLDGIAGIATVSLVVGGILFAFINYVQTAVQRRREDAEASFSIYREVYDRLMDEDAIEARRWIIFNLPTLEECGNDQEKWLDRVNAQVNRVPHGWKGDRAPGKEYLKNVLNTFDFIGFVAKHYWNMDNELVRWMSPSIAKVWERIEVYVEAEAKERKEDDYYESAREFGKQCVLWRKKEGLKSVIIDNAT